MSTTPLIALLALAPLQGPQLAVFQGAPGTFGNVLVVDADGLGPSHVPAGLAQVRLLALDFDGRVQLDRLRADRPRLFADVPGAARVLLPHGGGSLYRFARAEPNGQSFGFFVVDPLGQARSVFELPGIGPAGDADPFTGRVALDDDGDAMLVATTLAAGGDLYEVDLAQAGALLRSGSLAPLDVPPGGMALAPAWGIAATAGGVVRFDRAQPGSAASVTFPGGAPAWFGGEVVLSPSGTWAATFAGDGPTSAFPFAIAPAGSAVRASDQPHHVSGAGFLPGALHGPYLAISDDGTRCGFRVVQQAGAQVSREAFLARVQVAPSAVQLTGDQHFTDTIDEMGQFLFKPFSNRLLAAIGSLSDNPPFNIEDIDVFGVDLPPSGGPQFTNLSLTSGQASPPFLVPGELEPEDGMFWLPSADRFVLHNSASGGGGELVAVRSGVVGLQLVMPDVKELYAAERAGGSVALFLRRASGNKDNEVRVLDAATLALSPALLVTPDHEVFSSVLPRGDGAFAFVHETALGELIRGYDPTTAALALMINRPLAFASALGWLSDGDLVLTAANPAANSTFGRWRIGSLPRRLPLPQMPGFVLPGA